MKIGLYNLEPKIVNTAMMQVSTYHKSKGNEIEIYNPLFNDSYDMVYAFSLFDFTDKGYVNNGMITGGTGFDIAKRLDKEIEECDYDWSLYPKCDHSIVWFSRGCTRNCDFCVVNKKEGFIHPVEPKNLNPNGRYIRVQDNNFFANPKWKEAIKQLQEWKQPVVFEGVDARKLDKEMCLALLTLKHEKQIKIAWDQHKEDLVPKLKEIIKVIKPYRLMCYVLIGAGSNREEDEHRVYELMKLKIDPFAMPFNKKDIYQKDFTRWCNRPEIRKTCKFKDYKNKKYTLPNERGK